MASLPTHLIIVAALVSTFVPSAALAAPRSESSVLTAHIAGDATALDAGAATPAAAAPAAAAEGESARALVFGAFSRFAGGASAAAAIDPVTAIEALSKADATLGPVLNGIAFLADVTTKYISAKSEALAAKVDGKMSALRLDAASYASDTASFLDGVVGGVDTVRGGGDA